MKWNFLSNFVQFCTIFCNNSELFFIQFLQFESFMPFWQYLQFYGKICAIMCWPMCCQHISQYIRNRGAEPFQRWCFCQPWDIQGQVLHMLHLSKCTWTQAGLRQHQTKRYWRKGMWSVDVEESLNIYHRADKVRRFLEMDPMKLSCRCRQLSWSPKPVAWNRSNNNIWLRTESGKKNITTSPTGQDYPIISTWINEERLPANTNFRGNTFWFW